jgi:hypothetical protein
MLEPSSNLKPGIEPGIQPLDSAAPHWQAPLDQYLQRHIQFQMCSNLCDAGYGMFASTGMGESRVIPVLVS